MSNREQQIKFILKYAPHTSLVRKDITIERLNKLTNADLGSFYRKARNIVQKEIFEKGIKIPDEKKVEDKKVEDPRGSPPPAKYYNPYGLRDEERGNKPKKTQSLSSINMPEKMGDINPLRKTASLPAIHLDLQKKVKDTLDRFSEAIKEDDEDLFYEEEEEKTFVPREGVIEVEEEPNSALPPHMFRDDAIRMQVQVPRNEIVKTTRKQRKRDILGGALTDNGRKLWEGHYGNMKQTKWTNKMVKDFILNLNNDEIEMAIKPGYGGGKGIKEALQITEAQKKVQPQLGNLVATKTTNINIGIEKRENQLGVSGTTNVDIEKEEADLGVSDIKQINIQPSFGVNKKVVQKTIGTQLGLSDIGLSENQIEQVEQMGDLRDLVREGGNDMQHNLIRNTFGDNMIRDVNAGLTGLEINPSIPVRTGLGQPLVRNIVRSQLGVRGRIIEDESKLEQVDMLNGNEEELPHAQAVVGNIDDEELVEAQKLAGNNMYSEDQQLFLGRERANKTMERRKEPLDKEFSKRGGRGGKRVSFSDKDEVFEYGRGGRGGKRVSFSDKDEVFEYDNYEDIEPDQQGVDYGEIQPVEGRENMNQINQQYLENRNIRGRGTWTGNRGVGFDFTRQAIVDRESNHLRNAQSLNFLRGQSIPYNTPSRNYATNQVGLIRNSNRSMILEVNALEP